jgi:hypothetical protein
MIAAIFELWSELRYAYKNEAYQVQYQYNKGQLLRRKVRKYCSDEERQKINGSGDETSNFIQYINFWLGTPMLIKLCEKTKYFYGWNSHSFQVFTTYIDLYRMGNIKLKDSVWNLDECTDDYLKLLFPQMQKLIEMLVDCDLEVNCPHKLIHYT